MKLFLLIFILAVPAHSFGAVIREFSGKVYVHAENKRAKVRKKYHVIVGEEIVTRQNSTCLIDDSDQNTFLRLAPESNLVFSWDNEFEISHGMVWVRKRPGNTYINLKSHDLKFQTVEATFFIKKMEQVISVLVKSGSLLIQGPNGSLNLLENSFMKIRDGNLPEIRGARAGEFIEWNEPFE